MTWTLAGLTTFLEVIPAHASGGTAAEDLRASPFSHWSLPPLQLAPILLGGILYGLRARHLGRRLPPWRMLSFYGGLGVMIVAVCSPIDPIGEEALFSVHMLQHVLIGDIAPLLIVLGVTGPVLRPALAIGWVQRLRVLAHPLVALPLWALSFCVWHLRVLYEASLSNEYVHFLEHLSFFTFGLLLWAAVIEPLPGPEWFGTGAKILYLGAVRMVLLVVGNIFWFSGTAFYPAYADTAPVFGQTPLQDQINAGTIMVVEGTGVMIIVVIVLFFRMAREGEVRQALIDGGVDPMSARRAVRYGRGEELAARHGIRLGQVVGA